MHTRFRRTISRISFFSLYISSFSLLCSFIMRPQGTQFKIGVTAKNQLRSEQEGKEVLTVHPITGVVELSLENL